MFKKKIFLWVIGGVIILVIGTAVVMSILMYARKSIPERLKEIRGIQPFALKEGIELRQNMADTPAIPEIRKLIKRAELNLEVKDCEDVSKKIIDIVNSVSGVIIVSEIQKYPNESKRGWTVLKILPKDFDIVLRKLKELGKVDLERITTEDVTEEYIDLKARLKNFQRVKERLLKILDERAHKVKDILEVERELSRLGEQIERTEGRIKYLDRQIELATITVNYYEPKALVPEPLNIVKKFKETIRTAVETFINVFNGVIIVIAAILPILIWVSIVFLIIVIVKKLFIKKS